MVIFHFFICFQMLANLHAEFGAIQWFADRQHAFRTNIQRERLKAIVDNSVDFRQGEQALINLANAKKTTGQNNVLIALVLIEDVGFQQGIEKRFDIVMTPVIIKHQCSSNKKR